ncbi:MAG: ATP-binding cassette domain-containing protein, partial [Acidobacteria bacterium]|nr:ATP-binding cassette domain-containing protein [Acidobacteriota bacterium]
MAEPDAVLELRGVTKKFPTHVAVDDVSFRVPRGELFALLGPSGCGKTTTLRMVAGFEQPTSGEIWLNGRRIEHLRPYQRNVTTVFQSYALFP